MAGNLLSISVILVCLPICVIVSQVIEMHMSDLQKLHEDLQDHSQRMANLILISNQNSQVRKNDYLRLNSLLTDTLQKAVTLRDQVKKSEKVLQKFQKYIQAAPEGHGHTQNVLCTYSSWASGWKEPAQFFPTDIDPFLCTHITYSFANVNGNDMKIDYHKPDIDVRQGQYKQVNELRNINPRLKVLIAIGGSNAGTTQLTLVSRTDETRRRFAESVVNFIRKEDFDGLEINWKWPTFGSGIPEDKQNFIALLQELRRRFDEFGWLLTATVSPDPEKIERAYDIPGLAKFLDLMSVESYGFYKPENAILALQNALYPGGWEPPAIQYKNAAAAIQYYLNSDFPANKLLLGIGLMGIPLLMQDDDPNSLGSLVSTSSFAGPHLGADGFLAYFELCDMLKKENWTLSWHPKHESSFIFRGNKFVGMDDEVSLGAKVKYAQEKGLAGVMVRSVDIDDFKGLCGPKYPLLRAINKHLELFRNLRP